MEVTELTLWIARLGVLALMYIFVLAIIFAIIADARAASKPREAAQMPAAPLPRTGAAPARAASAITLTVVGGTPPSTGREYRPRGPLQIGRDSACDVVIPSHFVSKYHARISQAGQWMVEVSGQHQRFRTEWRTPHQPTGVKQRRSPGDRGYRVFGESGII